MYVMLPFIDYFPLSASFQLEFPLHLPIHKNIYVHFSILNISNDNISSLTLFQKLFFSQNDLHLSLGDIRKIKCWMENTEL